MNFFLVPVNGTFEERNVAAPASGCEVAVARSGKGHLCAQTAASRASWAVEGDWQAWGAGGRITHHRKPLCCCRWNFLAVQLPHAVGQLLNSVQRSARQRRGGEQGVNGVSKREKVWFGLSLQFNVSASRILD